MSGEVPNSEATVVRLPANSDARACAAIKGQLLPVLMAPETVVLDITGVQQIDTGAVQLLFGFIRDRSAGGLNTTWRGDSPALRSAAALLNLDVGPAIAPAMNGG